MENAVSANFTANKARTQSCAQVKAVGQARRQRACGKFERLTLTASNVTPSIREAVQTRHRELVGRTKQKTERGHPSDKSKPKADNSQIIGRGRNFSFTLFLCTEKRIAGSIFSRQLCCSHLQSGCLPPPFARPKSLPTMSIYRKTAVNLS